MKIYLGGGRSASKGESASKKLYDSLKKNFYVEGTKQVLHIPFSRPGFKKKGLADLPRMLQPFIESLGIEYLNAEYLEDIERFSGDTIYINGGDRCEFLMEMCQDPVLLNVLNSAKTIIGHSCGAMIMGEYFRDDKSGTQRVSGLAFVKGTNIEPHYTEKNKESRLKRSMQEKNIFHGLGVDEQTFAVYENGKFGKPVGVGKVFYL